MTITGKCAYFGIYGLADVSKTIVNPGHSEFMEVASLKLLYLQMS